MNDNTKIVIHNGKTVTLKGLFKGKEKSRKIMAALSFEEKIKMLVSLQELAYGWGRKKDVAVWKIP